ncbi:hypothetical protein DY000_02006186 [Brassica cretica]|uniref:Uncharacterized protein n=1 Tax=Brassica cretica TaxID=69181 RepID=A0ABQ7CHW8_BRACR|nr:hypothetical protein DY000_02006186 [Brassica cretica]
MGSDGDAEIVKEVEEIYKGLTEKEEELADLDKFNQTLILRERKTNFVTLHWRVVSLIPKVTMLKTEHVILICDIDNQKVEILIISNTNDKLQDSTDSKHNVCELPLMVYM